MKTAFRKFGGWIFRQLDQGFRPQQFERRNSYDYDYKMYELESPKGHYENHSVLIFILAIQKELKEDISKLILSSQGEPERAAH